MRSAIFLCVFATLWPAPVAAQPTEQERDERRTEVQRTRVDPTSTSALRLPLPQFTLIAERGKTEVKATIGMGIGDTNAFLEVSGPIGEKAEQAAPLSLSGLSKSATVTFGFSRSRLFLPVTTARLDAMEEFCRINNLDPCAMSQTTTPEQRRAFMDLFVAKTPTLYGVSATLGRAEFEFLSPDLQTDLKELHVTHGVTGSAGALFEKEWFVSSFVRYERAYKPASEKPQNICTPLAGGALKCRDTRLGPPTSDENVQWGLELRRRFERLGLGIAPRFEYRFDDGQKALEAPLYFLRAAEDQAEPAFAQRLNGGVSIGWKTGKGFAAKAFVGLAFDLLKMP